LAEQRQGQKVMRFLQCVRRGLLLASLLLAMSSVSANNPSECYSSSMDSYQSRLVMDAQGACWFEDAGDGETAASMARDLSHDKVIIVIVAIAPENVAAQAAEFARQLSDWLESRDEIQHQVPVVVRNDGEGLAFTAFVDGGRIYDDEHPLGLYNVDDIQLLLPRIVRRFQAALLVRYEKIKEKRRQNDSLSD
jgi:hypothetical protein